MNSRRQRGRQAEHEIARILDALQSNRFAVFHNIRAQYGNIDHLVLSKAGAIFIIETKSHRGRVTVQEDRLFLNERPRPDLIAQVNRNIRWLQEVIQAATGKKQWIAAVLVFTNASVPRRARVKRVNIVDKAHLLALIESHPAQPAQQGIWNNRTLFLTLRDTM